MMVQEYQFKREKMYLNHFIKSIKVDQKKVQVLDWDFQYLLTLLDLMEVKLNWVNQNLED